MSNFAEYFSKPGTQDEYKHFVIGMLINQYSEMGEQIPRFSINNGKLETDSQRATIKVSLYVARRSSVCRSFRST